MRPVLRLFPLSLCIALSLQVRAADDPPQNWRLCPIGDVVPPFADALRAPEGLNIDPDGETPTDIEGDLLSGTDANPMFQGNVTMRRGDQFMGADQLTFDKEAGHYAAEGSVRFQARGLRLRAARAEGDQDTDTHTMENLQYQLLERHGNGQAESLNLVDEMGTLHGATFST